MSEHQLWNELGNIYINSGAFEQAIKAYDKAIESDAEFGWAYNNKALAYMRLGESEKSIPLYQRSIELLSDFRDKAIAWHRLGNSYQVMDDTKNAILAFQRAVDLDLDNTVYRNDLAVAMAEYTYETDEEQEEAEAVEIADDVPLAEEADIVEATPEVEIEDVLEEAEVSSEVEEEDSTEITEEIPDVEEEGVSMKSDFASWLEQTIEKLSNKSFEKKTDRKSVV